MNIDRWNALTEVDKKRLASKLGLTLKGNNELWNEDELNKIPVVEPKVDVAIDPVLDNKVEEIVIIKKKRTYVKKTKKPAVKLGSKTLPKRGRPKRSLGKKR